MVYAAVTHRYAVTCRFHANDGDILARIGVEKAD